MQGPLNVKFGNYQSERCNIPEDLNFLKLHFSLNKYWTLSACNFQFQYQIQFYNLYLYTTFLTNLALSPIDPTTAPTLSPC